MADHLAPPLPNLVSINQSAFIKGRSIQDNFLLIKQMERYLHWKREPHILLKLDISKAFDSVSWPFPLEILQHLSFGQASIWSCDQHDEKFRNSYSVQGRRYRDSLQYTCQIKEFPCTCLGLPLNIRKTSKAELHN